MNKLRKVIRNLIRESFQFGNERGSSKLVQKLDAQMSKNLAELTVGSKLENLSDAVVMIDTLEVGKVNNFRTPMGDSWFETSISIYDRDLIDAIESSLSLAGVRLEHPSDPAFSRNYKKGYSGNRPGLGMYTFRIDFRVFKELGEINGSRRKSPALERAQREGLAGTGVLKIVERM